MTKQELAKMVELENEVKALTAKVTTLCDLVNTLNSRCIPVTTNPAKPVATQSKATSTKSKAPAKPATKSTKTSTKSNSNFDRDLYIACAKELGVYSEQFGKVPKAHRQEVYALMAKRQTAKATK